jgi:prevent-host-death family protein
LEQVNILDARNRLSQLISAARAGEDVVIANRGKPVVRIVSVEEPTEHTAANAALWLTYHPVPGHRARTAAELDEQIAREREGWE